MALTTVQATGLTCTHCAMSLTEEVQQIENVTEVNVRVAAGGRSTVSIEHSGHLDPARVEAAIKEAGFEPAP